MSYERPLKTNDDVKAKLEDIFSGKNMSDIEPKLIKIQRWTRSHLTRNKIRKLAILYRESDHGKRSHLCQLKTREIIDTENSYLNSLTDLVKRYYEPMNELTISTSRFFSSPLLSSKDHSLIFMNIVLIKEFHDNFYKELMIEYKKWPAEPVRIGKTFVKYSPFLKLYTEYTNCYQQSSETLQKVLEKSSFANWMDLHKQENMDCLPLESLLIMPVQRIPRYRMLLEEVIKYTPNEHIDYDDLCKALEVIKSIASYINERKRESEHVGKVIKIQSKIKGLDMNIAQPTRRLLKRGELLRFNPSSNAKEKRFFYLFNDMMMSTIPVENDDISIYDGYILIRNSKIIECKGKTDFGIRYDTGKIVYYHAISEKKKDKWIFYFKKGIDELSKLPLEQSPDFLLEKEHFGGGTSKREGMMKQYETKVLTRLHERWFTLKNGILYKKKSPTAKDLKYSLQLENYKLRTDSLNNKNEFAFDIVHPLSERTFVLKNSYEKRAWINAIEDSIKNINMPITDLCVIQLDKGDKVPLGFNPIQETYYAHPGDTNGETGGRTILICYEKGGKTKDNKPKIPITDISIAYTDTGSLLKRKQAEEIPYKDGWIKIDKTYYERDVADLNRGRGGRDVYLVYKREPKKPAITRLSIYWNINDETCPPNFVPVEYTVTGSFMADLNGGSGTEIYLCYQKESNEDKFFQSELGWDPYHGFNKSKMSLAWQDVFKCLNITDNQITKDNDLIRFIAEEVLKKYREIIQRRDKPNIVSCYCCKRTFAYPPNTNKVMCPYCQTVNQCIYVTSNVVPSAYDNPPKRTFAASCDTRVHNTQTNPLQKAQSVVQVPQNNLPSYATISQSNNLPSYAQPAVIPENKLPSYLPAGTVVYTPNIPPMEIPLGLVLKREEEIKDDSNTATIDFSILSDIQYKELLSFVSQRISLRNDGLEDFEIIEHSS